MWRAKMAEMVGKSGVRVVGRNRSGEDEPDCQYAQRCRHGGGLQTGLGDLYHGKLPSFATHNETPRLNLSSPRVSHNCLVSGVGLVTFD
ncbi:MAG: hypothetical protein QOH65_1768 [Methylobacteriaceae bacterium]|nr:hypothetical protein [Methylobacteriaceae bacterium]